MIRTQSDVVKDGQNENFKMVKVQWWVLINKRSNLNEQHLYEDCWNGKWKCNLIDPKSWLDISKKNSCSEKLNKQKSNYYSW
jgi:hypothetical protein